jgi:SPP1 gp7 family putative phage head morphogenesis protein
MEAVMLDMCDAAIEEYVATGKYTKPPETDLYLAMEKYYKSIITNAFYSAQLAKHMQAEAMQSSKKKLAAKLPWGIPNKLGSLVKFFADKRQWTAVQKRAHKIVSGLRRTYFKKLDRKFNQIGPQLQNGEKSPEDVKKELRKSWKATKSRVENIFRTETTNYYNRVQVSYFDGDEDIIGFLFQATGDSSTTSICKARHGLVYRPGTEALMKNRPALHYNCRSELIPLANTPGNNKLLKDPRRDPSKRRVPPLPPGWVAGRR